MILNMVNLESDQQWGTFNRPCVCVYFPPGQSYMGSLIL